MTAYGTTNDSVNFGIIADASNIIDGTNPPYLLSDFYATYPAYTPRSTTGDAIATVVLNQGGTGYVTNDILTVSDGTSGAIRVDTVNVAGVILTFSLLAGGANYETDTNVVVSGGSGNGATFDITVGTESTSLVDPLIIQMYIDVAMSVVKEARYHSYWKPCIGFFVAHFVTLYLQSLAGSNASAAQVIAAAQSRGLQASKSVGDVSVSYDYSSISNDLDGWAQWKLTVYGQQYASIAKLLGRGGMMVW